MIKTLNLTTLHWNQHTRSQWADKRPHLEDRIKSLQWKEVVDGKIQLPGQAALEIKAYADKAQLQKVLEVAVDVMPGNCVYGIKAQFDDGVAHIFLHSDMKRVTTLCTTLVKNG